MAVHFKIKLLFQQVNEKSRVSQLPSFMFLLETLDYSHSHVPIFNKIAPCWESVANYLERVNIPLSAHHHVPFRPVGCKLSTCVDVHSHFLLSVFPWLEHDAWCVCVWGGGF